MEPGLGTKGKAKALKHSHVQWMRIERTSMEDLYYIDAFSTDESGNLVPLVASVFAENEADAAALLLDCFSGLVSHVDFGDIKKAHRMKRGFLLTSGKIESIPPTAAE